MDTINLNLSARDVVLIKFALGQASVKLAGELGGASALCIENPSAYNEAYHASVARAYNQNADLLERFRIMAREVAPKENK